jgi:hypothetical protein
MASAGGSLEAGDGQCRNSHRSARAPPAVRGHAGHITRCYETAAHSLNSRLCRVPGGDRHFCADGAKPGQALTLIEAEALEDVGLTRAQSRRQVVVRGVRLNDLVGRRLPGRRCRVCRRRTLRAVPASPVADPARDHQGSHPPRRAQRRHLDRWPDPRGRPGVHRVEVPRPAPPRVPLNMIGLCPRSRTAAMRARSPCRRCGCSV